MSWKEQEAFQNRVLSRLDSMQSTLNRVGFKLNFLINRAVTMAKELDDLTREVEENNSVIDGAIVLLANLSQMIRDAQNDPAKLAALASSLDSKSNALAEAVAANTPAAPTSTPAPEPPA